MREFFKQKLKNLKAETGLNQWENFSSMPDAVEQFEILFDAIDRVCEQFNYIPDESKKTIVNEQILSDPDFKGLNAKIVWKWFNQVKDRYFKEAAHVPTESAPPVAYEDLSPETKKKYDEFLASLLDDSKGVRPVPQVSQEEIKSLELEDDRLRGKALAVQQYQTREEEIEIRKRIEEAAKKRGFEKVINITEFKSFNIEGKLITARNKEEAMEIYLEVYV